MEHKSHMQSSEDYLKALFLLQRKTPYIRPTDLAIQMGYTKPSISRAISMLKKDGLITRDREGHICLTEKGTLAAEKVYERHCFFMERLVAAGSPRILRRRRRAGWSMQSAKRVLKS